MSEHRRLREADSKSALREIALTVGATLGVICMAAAFGAALFGITPLVFRSGSMSPVIETGALALARTIPASEVRVGDIVTVERAGGDRLTHRVTVIDESVGGAATLTLKGDANEFPDSEPYTVAEVQRVFAHVEHLGRAVTWLSSPAAVFAGGLLAGVLILAAWKPTDKKPREDERPAVGASGGASAAGAVVGVALLAISVVQAPPASAAPLTDTGTATTGTFTTKAGVPAPGDLQCANRGFVVRYAELNWLTSGTGASYTYTLKKTGSADIVVTASPTFSTSRWRQDVENGAILGLGSLSGVYTATVTATIGGVTSAASGPQTITMDPGVLGLLLPSARCGGVASLSARMAPPAESAIAPSTTGPTTATTTESAPKSTTSTIEAAPTTAPSTTMDPSTTSSTPPAAPTTTTESIPVPATTTPETTPEATVAEPVDLMTPQSSPSGSATARIVDDQGSIVLLVEDSSGSALYRGAAPSDYRLVWADDGSLWFEGSGGLRRLASDTGWSPTSVLLDDPSVPPEILSAFG